MLAYEAFTNRVFVGDFSDFRPRTAEYLDVLMTTGNYMRFVERMNSDLVQYSSFYLTEDGWKLMAYQKCTSTEEFQRAVDGRLLSPIGVRR